MFRAEGLIYNPSRTAVPVLETNHSTITSDSSPKRDCSPRRVNKVPRDNWYVQIRDLSICPKIYVLHLVHHCVGIGHLSAQGVERSGVVVVGGGGGGGGGSGGGVGGFGGGGRQNKALGGLLAAKALGCRGVGYD